MTVPAVQVLVPRDDADLDAVRALMRDFVTWHRSRHEADRHLVEAYFDDAAFDREVAQVHLKYALPTVACCWPCWTAHRWGAWLCGVWTSTPAR